jgi:uncharacterized membrane protein YfcA
MDHPAILIGFGVFVGVFSGIMGLGGGAIMIPLMVLALGFSQTKAHGLSLAVMIPPVTLPAVIAYYKKGALEIHDIRTALIIAAGFACGSFFGGYFAASLPKDTLKLIFGFVLVYVAGYTIFSWFGHAHLLRSVLLASVLALFAVGMFMVTKAVDGRVLPLPSGEGRGEGIQLEK